MRNLSFIRPFAQNRRGNVAMVFGLSAFVIFSAVGAAVDMSRVDLARRKLQDAADAAVLRTLPMTKATDGQRQTAADQAFSENLNIGGVSGISGQLVKEVDGKTTYETYRVNAVVSSYFGAFFGKANYPVAVASKAQTQAETYEIAFVLDSTGSMASAGKMVNLKSSVDSALASLLNSSGVNTSNSQVAIVPFNTQVRLSNSAISNMSTLKLINGASGNCMMDRDQPNDTTVTAADQNIANTLYQRVNCAYSTTKETQGLSPDIASARSFIQTLQPGGNTNITIGVQWGMEVLSPNEPFTGGVAFNDTVIKKYMIVVTDGDNTANRWTGDQKQIDARTALACTHAKALGITVFTVKVIQGNSTLLRECASDPAYFYDLTNATQLNAAMAGIFTAISKPRLTQ